MSRCNGPGSPAEGQTALHRTPAQVSPIGVGAFFSSYGLRVLQNEGLSVWLPTKLLVAFARYRRTRTDSAGPVR